MSIMIEMYRIKYSVQIFMKIRKLMSKCQIEWKLMSA
jgi:hypothetical protein